jgi:hypothetical protein
MTMSVEAAEAVADECAKAEIFQFFAHAHLPSHLAAVSRQFHNLAETIIVTLPACEERAVALRKLLEAKDAAVRAKLWKSP